MDTQHEDLQSLRIDMTVRRLPWVALADISPALTSAVLQAEDQRFYRHGGVDVDGPPVTHGRAAYDGIVG